MGFISELKEFMHMERSEQEAICHLLQQVMQGFPGKPVLAPYSAEIKKGTSPKAVVLRYFDENHIQIPVEMEQDVNWPKLYQTLIKKGLLIPVEEDDKK